MAENMQSRVASSIIVSIALIYQQVEARRG